MYLPRPKEPHLKPSSFKHLLTARKEAISQIDTARTMDRVYETSFRLPRVALLLWIYRQRLREL
jgi:hypothetical protein